MRHDTIRKSNKRKGYCLHCYTNLFPNEPIIRNFMNKERALRERLTEKLPDYDLVFNHRIDGQSCFSNRPDVFVDLLTHVIVIECDENQHKDRQNYSCENKRSMQIVVSVDYRPTVLLRFNPDAYTDANGKRKRSCFALHEGNGAMYLRDKKEHERRVAVLVERFRHHANNVPDKSFTEEKLFYDPTSVSERLPVHGLPI